MKKIYFLLLCFSILVGIAAGYLKSYNDTNNDNSNIINEESALGDAIISNEKQSDLIDDTKDNTIDDIEETDTDDDESSSEASTPPDTPTKITNTDSLTVLVNKIYYLDADYVPNNLVVPDVKFSYSDPSEYEKSYMQQEAAIALEQLFDAAKSESIHLFAVSGYRSYSRQKTIYENNLRNKGEEYTNKYSAQPGHSEHQTGLVMDVSCDSVGYDLVTEFENTKEGQWLAENCHKYGFIIRYPKDKTSITGYEYEPWHIRYVGIELATELTEKNITLDEYYYNMNLTP